jgi:hypothetical protein
MASKYINNMPIGERDCEDAGNVAPGKDSITVAILSHENKLLATAPKRNALRSKMVAEFHAKHGRAPMRSELDQILDVINRQFGL